MTTVNMTKDRARYTADRAVKASFDPRMAALEAAEDALAREAYATVYSDEEITAAKAMPDGWIRKDPCLNYAVDGLRVTLTTQSDHLLVPYRTKDGSSGYRCHPEQGKIFGTDLARRIVAHIHAVEALKTERREAHKKLVAFIGSFRTVQKLATAWPEGEPFYGQYLAPKEDGNLPAPIVNEINDLLGLKAAARAEPEKVTQV